MTKSDESVTNLFKRNDSPAPGFSRSLCALACASFRDGCQQRGLLRADDFAATHPLHPGGAKREMAASKSTIVAALAGALVGGVIVSVLRSRRSKSSKKMTLHYFDIAGKAEATRLAAVFGGLSLHDNRLTREEFLQMKPNLPYGQVPILELEDGTMIGQSAAILRFVGKQAGLYPVDDDILASKIDSLLDEEIDFFTGVTVSRYPTRFGFALIEPGSAEHATVRKSLNDEILPKHLAFLDKVLKNSSTGWLADTPGPTVADFCFVPRLQWLVAPGINDGIDTDLITSKFPRVQAFIDKFMDLPAIKAYYEARQS